VVGNSSLYFGVEMHFKLHLDAQGYVAPKFHVPASQKNCLL
jgi:hypothetical protein